MQGKRVILTGATGLVGGCALRICLADQAVARVTVIGRRSVGLEHAKLTEVLHESFQDYGSIAGSLGGHDVALYCLGVYTGAVPDNELRRITVDVTGAFARALLRASPDTTFCFLSGQGADQTGTSRIAFARYKGMAETALLDLGFPRVAIFRPGYIYPVIGKTGYTRAAKRCFVGAATGEDGREIIVADGERIELSAYNPQQLP